MGVGECRRAWMKNEFDYLLDSDVPVGRFFPDDPHNQNARNIFAALEDERKSLVTTSLVIVETATVLSHVVDCSNVTVMQKFNMPAIVSFDKVYENSFGLNVFHTRSKRF